MSAAANAQTVTFVNKSEKISIKEIFIKKINSEGISASKWTTIKLKEAIAPSNGVKIALSKSGNYKVKVVWLLSTGFRDQNVETIHYLENVTGDINYSLKLSH